MGPEILPKALRNPGKQRIKQLVKPSSLYIYNQVRVQRSIGMQQLVLDAAARSRCFGEINKKYSVILVLLINRAYEGPSMGVDPCMLYC